MTKASGSLRASRVTPTSARLISVGLPVSAVIDGEWMVNVNGSIVVPYTD